MWKQDFYIVVCSLLYIQYELLSGAKVEIGPNILKY